MKKSILCALMLILFIPFVSYSANDMPIKTQKKVVPKTNPENECYKSDLEIKIENIENECIENNMTQGGMNACAGKSLEAWDKALNDIYGKLLNRLDEKGKIALRNTQREWLKYRDSHYKFLDIYYKKFDGSMYVGMNTKDATTIVRDRTLTLNLLLKLLELEAQ